MNENTPRSNKVEMLTPQDALGRVAIEFARKLEIENERLRSALEKYRGQINQHGNHSAADDLDA